MSAVTAARSPLLASVTTGTSVPVDVSRFPRLVLYVTGFGTISTGTLLVEEADYNIGQDAPFAGTWSLITTLDLTTLTGGGSAGIQLAYHFPTPDMAYGAVRVRVGTGVTGSGGAISAVLRAQG